jgi:hypothetical protein
MNTGSRSNAVVMDEENLTFADLMYLLRFPDNFMFQGTI